MKSLFPQNITQESIFVWLLHRISEEFGKHAILKGGMSLYLLNSSRATNDLDFVFVPYRSKKDITPALRKIVEDIPNAKILISINSKALRIGINVENIGLQIEADVAQNCKSIAISTESMAKRVGVVPRVVSIMDLGVALSHKIAAWNERRLVRDLYDIYFLVVALNMKPDMETLTQRLSNVQSRLPALKKKKQMTLYELIHELVNVSANITLKDIQKELSAILPKNEILGMDLKIKTAILKLTEILDIYSVPIS